MNDKTAPDDALAPLRQQIDELDQQLIDLLNERARVVVEVGHIKNSGQTDTPIYAPDREQQVLAKIRKRNQGPLPNSCIEAIWRELMSGSFALERPLRVGYLGPQGTFSHLAARRKFGASIEYDNLVGISSVFEEVHRGHIDLGVVPIENSTEGAVGDTLDSFLTYSGTDVNVCAEILLGIHHNLLANCPLNEIKRVYSHPQPLAQCRNWLSSQLPNAERITAASTSKAAEIASREPGSAAISSKLAAELYNLKTLFENIEDNPSNTTRFFIIGKQYSRPTGDDKTSIMFTTEHAAGALSDVLNVFRDHGINLTHIDKRPSKRVNWEYYFFIDVQGHIKDDKVTKAIEDAKKHCLQINVLGAYPRARDVL
ncbi:P-protein [Poriferisphaera corsica]|uniref:Bifunctional chorismate mutase/prephenate dehydratase n=1 Tax=Poriferisphaera corsica TaxID=2528020 RepID=A0A517YUK9_9BACT|nr:prephenate dehydratase [Poriferisphaera corsica]QDU33842.1 P-protein [Poriferisphaera corsica]